MNEISGQVDGTAVQAGTVHGGVHIHAAEPERPIPRQLPPDTSCFTGREEQLARLDERPRQVLLVTGTAGVGKTSLAVRWGHLRRGLYPDGQLYVNLHSYSARVPVTAGEALVGFLRALNVGPEFVPATDEDRAALYRSLTDGRRLLVVVDNASNADQVRPLLPAEGSTVLVTSRNRLAGLVSRDGAERIGLDVLHPAESVTLLRSTAGADRVDADPESAARLTEQCAHLPLALRVAAERVAGDPFTTLADLTADLAAEENRLDVLSSEEDPSSAVRAVLSWSYRRLSPDTAAAFRAFGLHLTPEASLPAVVALLGVPTDRVRGSVDALVSAHLVQKIDRDRYRLHDLLRAYAVELAAVDPDRDPATRRVLAWYLRTTAAADQVLLPLHRKFWLPDDDVTPLVFTDRATAMSWLERERWNLVTAVGQAAQSGHHDIAACFAPALSSFFDLRKHWTGWLATVETGLASARAVGDRSLEAHALGMLGVARYDTGRYAEAVELYRESLAVSREVADERCEANSLTDLARVHRKMRRSSDALGCLHESLAIRQRIGDDHGLAITLNRLGSLHRDMGRLDDSLRYLTRSHELRLGMGDLHGVGFALYSLALTHQAMGNFDKAVQHYRASVEVHHRVGNVSREALALDRLARLLHRSGDTAVAATVRWQSDKLYALISNPEAKRGRDRGDRPPVD